MYGKGVEEIREESPEAESGAVKEEVALEKEFGAQQSRKISIEEPNGGDQESGICQRKNGQFRIFNNHQMETTPNLTNRPFQNGKIKPPKFSLFGIDPTEMNQNLTQNETSNTKNGTFLPLDMQMENDFRRFDLELKKVPNVKPLSYYLDKFLDEDDDI